MNGDLVFLVFATLVPPIWLVVGIVGRAGRLRRVAVRERRDIDRRVG